MPVDTTVLRGGPLPGYVTKSVAGNANVTLSSDEARNRNIELTGALTGNITVTVPTAGLESAGLEYTVFNNTTGVFSVTFQGSSGAGVVLSQGYRTDVRYDGTVMGPKATGAFSREMAVITGIAGNITLTEAQARAGIVNLQGTPGAPFNVVVPNGVGLWIINNATNSTANVKTAAGAAAAVTTGTNRLVFIDTSGNGGLI